MITLKSNNGRAAMPRFSTLMDTFFENEFPGFLDTEWSKASEPMVNVKETTNAFALDVIAPGFSKENLGIKIEDQLLTISGVAEETKSEEKYTRKEYVHRSFKRAFTLPKTISLDKVAAVYENGVLTITLPKVDESKAKSSIDIKVS